LQLKASFTHAARARATNVRGKSRLPQLVIATMLVGAGVCGFALSQWIAEHRRAAQDLVAAELRARIEQMSRTEGRLTGAYNEIETSVLRNIGLQGVVVTATETPWTSSRVTPGQEAAQARFADGPVEIVDDATAKQVCERFAQWSTEHGRVARVVVRYTL